MTNVVEITKDKSEASFIVKCKDSVFAKNLSRKIYGLWEKCIENGKEPGTYAHDMYMCGDLLTCVPCNENLLLWFDVRVNDERDQKIDMLHEFIKRCATEQYLSDINQGF